MASQILKKLRSVDKKGQRNSGKKKQTKNIASQIIAATVLIVASDPRFKAVRQ